MTFIRSGWVLRLRHDLDVAAVAFATVPGCYLLVVDPTHSRGGTLDLLMTDVPDLVPVVIVAPIGNLDHSSSSAVISMVLVVPNLCVVEKFCGNIKSIVIQSVVQ